MKKLSALLAASLLAASSWGCFDGEIKITVYPDGSGRIEIDGTIPESTLEQLRAAGQSDEKILEFAKERVGRLFPDKNLSFLRLESEQTADGKIRVHGEALSGDLSKMAPKRGVKLYELGLQEIEGGHRLRLISAREQKPFPEKARKSYRKAFADMKFKIVVVMPADVTRQEGLDSHDGREARGTLTGDGFVDLRGDGFTKGETLWEIDCGSEVKTTDEDMKKFKKDLAVAKEADQRGKVAGGPSVRRRRNVEQAEKRNPDKEEPKKNEDR